MDMPAQRDHLELMLFDSIGCFGDVQCGVISTLNGTVHFSSKTSHPVEKHPPLTCECEVSEVKCV